MNDAYTEGVKQGRYIRDTHLDLPSQLQTSHAQHCAIECGFIHQQEQYIQGYIAGYSKEECSCSACVADQQSMQKEH